MKGVSRLVAATNVTYVYYGVTSIELCYITVIRGGGSRNKASKNMEYVIWEYHPGNHFCTQTLNGFKVYVSAPGSYINSLTNSLTIVYMYTSALTIVRESVYCL